MIVRTLAVSVLLLAFAGGSYADSPGEKKAEIRKMRSETLAKLYKAHPAAKGKIGSAYVYAVFSNAGINLIFASIAAGRGIAHNNKTGKDIYMKMASGGIGLGLGVQDFRGIFIFKTRKAFTDFVEDGWEGGAHADAIAKDGDKGGAAEGALTVSKDMELYKITQTDLPLPS